MKQLTERCCLTPLLACRYLADGQLLQRLQAACDAMQLRSLLQQLDSQRWLQAVAACLRQQHQAMPPAPPAHAPPQPAAVGAAAGLPLPPLQQQQLEDGGSDSGDDEQPQAAQAPGLPPAAGATAAAIGPAPPPDHPLARPGMRAGYAGVAAAWNGRWAAQLRLGVNAKSTIGVLLHTDPQVAAVARDVAHFWRTHIKRWPGQRAALHGRWAGCWLAGCRQLLCCSRRGRLPCTLHCLLESTEKLLHCPLLFLSYLADGRLMRHLRTASDDDATQLRHLLSQLERQGWLAAAADCLRQQQALPPVPAAAEDTAAVLLS